VLLEREDSFAVAQIEFADGTAVVRILVDLDVSVTFVLAEQMAELAHKKPDRLVFDMAAVGYVDCASADVLFGAARSILPGGNKPVICSPAPVVRRLLEVADLDTQGELAG
jgi:anti-anti-sigma factor